jgi:carbamoyl-phosphate synthase small subunit
MHILRSPSPDGAQESRFRDGRTIWGRGSAEGQVVGELCFHTAMTGYRRS